MYDITRWVHRPIGVKWGAPGYILSCTRVVFSPHLLALLRSRETYNSLAAWLTDARTLASPNIVVILCGNKKDLDPEREVTFLESSRFAQENGEGPASGNLGHFVLGDSHSGTSGRAPLISLRLCPARQCGGLGACKNPAPPLAFCTPLGEIPEKHQV